MIRTRAQSRALPDRRSRYLGSPHYRMLSLAAPEFTISPLIKMCNSSWQTATWFSANDPIAFPFVLNEAAVVVEFGWVNGTASGGNVDVGIYDTAWNRIVSAGSTAAGSANAWGWANITDTAIPAGRYYLVQVRDNVTANRVTRFSPSGAGFGVMAGCKESSTDAFPLPNPLTNMVEMAANAVMPGLGMVVTRAHAT